jgi:ATP-dependent RNA helicase UAP56/SUB2
MYGGQPIQEHITSLKGVNPPHIIVGTPGRILALTKQKHLDFTNLKIFVLDECDKMLEETGNENIEDS